MSICVILYCNIFMCTSQLQQTKANIEMKQACLWKYIHKTGKIDQTKNHEFNQSILSNVTSQKSEKGIWQNAIKKSKNVVITNSARQYPLVIVVIFNHINERERTQRAHESYLHCITNIKSQDIFVIFAVWTCWRKTRLWVYVYN